MATDVIVLFALEREAKPFRKLCPNVPVQIIGVGERAKTATEAILKSKPSHVILAGFGGALSTSARVGDILVGREVIDESGSIWHVGDGTARVLTVNRMIATVEEKVALGVRHRAAVCDMESAIVAAGCANAGVPLTVVRAISDTAIHTLPAALERIIVDGEVSAWQAFTALLGQPSLMIEYYRLSRDTRIAAKSLAVALSELIHEKTHP